MARRRHRTSDRFRQPIPKISFAYTGVATFVTLISALILHTGVQARPDVSPALAGLSMIFGMVCIYCSIKVWSRIKSPEDTFMKLCCIVLTTLCATLHVGVYIIGLLFR